MKQNNKIPVRRMMRIMVVMVVYNYELLNKKIDTKEIFESDIFNEYFDYKKLKIKNYQEIMKEQLQIISLIEKNYEVFKKTICNFVREDWSWERMAPLIRAILLCASVELWKLDIPIVANEYVEITKEFVPDDESYKFVNIIIEKIGKHYHEIKNQKN